MPNPIPQSQLQIVRNVARKAWRVSAGNGTKAKSELGQYLAREIGAAWLNEGQRIGSALIDHWEENAVSSPTVQWIEGEPR